MASRGAYSLAHPSAQRGWTEGHASQPEEEAPCDSSLFSVVIMMEMQPFLQQRAPSKPSLQPTIAPTAHKITAEQTLASVIIQIYVLIHQETLMHSPYCILSIPLAFRPPCCQTFLSSSSADQQLKSLILFLFVGLLDGCSVRLPEAGARLKFL